MEKVKRKPNTIYTLSLSYGKDSLACLGAIEKLGLPLDRIVHAEVWATQDIPADLPPMVEFKAKADEPERIERHEKKEDIMLPLVKAGWDEAYCRKWCEERDLLSPIYTSTARGGCWFCHNQGVEQLRLLRQSNPQLWGLLLRWDKDSPVKFKPDGHTVHDYDERFRLEDEGVVDKDEPFYWRYLQQKQLRIQGI